MSYGEEIIYDPRAAEFYSDAHGKVQQAGSLAQEINDVFQTQIPQVFVGGASQSIVDHHRIINEKFTDAHDQLVKLLNDTAPGEMADLFALDRQLGNA